MIVIDGSRGEGGGQVLRSSLALSMITGQPFRIENIRANRSKPGLLRQHLTCVRAAAAIGGAEVSGAELRSSALEFHPRTIAAGSYEFDIGSAGSSTLVLQTVLPALLCGDGPVELTITGGTHNQMSPPYDFLARAFVPLLRRMGASIELQLERYGFYPRGGGRIRVRLEPGELSPLKLTERGATKSRSITAMLSKLPRHIGEREVESARDVLGWSENKTEIRELDKRFGPGNVLLIEVESEHVTEVVTGFGQKGVRAEQVGKHAAREAKHYLDSGAPVGEHLADQLLLPFALAGGGRMHTVKPSLHTTTQFDVMGAFFDPKVSCEQIDDRAWAVEVGGQLARA